MGLYALPRLRGDEMSLVGFQAQNHRQQVGRRGALDKVDDRRTPRELYDPLNEEFGFTLDVAASAENALTERYYDPESDGLVSSWHAERVWCNPPYSDIRPWVEKVGRSNAQLVVMLLPSNRTEQAWWQDLIEPGRLAGRIEVRFQRGRLRFDTPDHDYTKQPKGNRPPFGVCLVIWRNP
jgi:phage N-6-adenine-methyltransferase